MNKNQVDTLTVVELAVKFIRTLSKEELREIINAEKKIGIVKEKEEVANIINEKNNKFSKKIDNEYNQQKHVVNKMSQKQVSIFEVDEVNEFDIYIRELSRFRSKEVAVNYLLENKLTVTKLKILAKKLSIYIKSKSKKIDIIQAIVEGIVGSRLKLESLRDY